MKSFKQFFLESTEDDRLRYKMRDYEIEVGNIEMAFKKVYKEYKEKIKRALENDDIDEFHRIQAELWCFDTKFYPKFLNSIEHYCRPAPLSPDSDVARFYKDFIKIKMQGLLNV